MPAHKVCNRTDRLKLSNWWHVNQQLISWTNLVCPSEVAYVMYDKDIRGWECTKQPWFEIAIQKYVVSKQLKAAAVSCHHLLNCQQRVQDDTLHGCKMHLKTRTRLSIKNYHLDWRLVTFDRGSAFPNFGDVLDTVSKQPPEEWLRCNRKSIYLSMLTYIFGTKSHNSRSLPFTLANEGKVRK